ncbi:alpha/beta hydrolase [soil metagenome]
MSMRSPRFASLLGIPLLALGCASNSATQPRQLDATRASAPVTAANAPAEAAKRSFTFVLVHGAWGGGYAFKDVENRLRADGHEVHRVTLTGQGERAHLYSPDITLSTHVQDVVNTILYEDLHNVVLVGHSYGGMVITGVADQVPDRISRLIYVDALLPENGESWSTAVHGDLIVKPDANGYLTPDWLVPGEAPPHDVPQSAKTATEPLILKHEDLTRKIPGTYLLLIDPGKKAEEDRFYPFYERAKARGYALMSMESGHNAQRTKPAELVEMLEKAGMGNGE